MKNLLLLISFLSLLSCKKEVIERVEISSYGGELGYQSKLAISKDSVVYFSKLLFDTTKNKSYKTVNKPESWQNLIKSINIDDFAKAKEGESMVQIDGIDNKIVVKTNKRTISKVNTYANYSWDQISTYSEFYYPQK